MRKMCKRHIPVVALDESEVFDEDQTTKLCEAFGRVRDLVVACAPTTKIVTLPVPADVDPAIVRVLFAAVLVLEDDDDARERVYCTILQTAFSSAAAGGDDPFGFAQRLISSPAMGFLRPTASFATHFMLKAFMYIPIVQCQEPDGTCRELYIDDVGAGRALTIRGTSVFVDDVRFARLSSDDLEVFVRWLESAYQRAKPLERAINHACDNPRAGTLFMQLIARFSCSATVAYSLRLGDVASEDGMPPLHRVPDRSLPWMVAPL